MSVIFVTDEKNMFHSPAIRQLVTRSGQEVPALLEAMADLAIQASQLKLFRFLAEEFVKFYCKTIVSRSKIRTLLADSFNYTYFHGEL